MARARNIKPGLPRNEDLAECSIAARYLFVMLPMVGDRDGRMEDRPKRIKGDLFPFDSIEVDPLLDELDRQRMIRRYEVNGVRLIQILAFAKHQKPHHREPASTLPPPPGLVLNAHGKWHEPGADQGSDDGDALGEDGADGTSDDSNAAAKTAMHEAPAPGTTQGAAQGKAAALVPLQGGAARHESGKMNDESGKMKEHPPTPRKRGPSALDLAHAAERFARFWVAYPRKVGKDAAWKAFAKRDPDEETLQAMSMAIERQGLKARCQRGEDRFVPHPATWLNERRWEDEVPDASSSGAGDDQVDDRDVEALLKRDPSPTWLAPTGFANIFEAENEGCYQHNASQFRDGKRLPQAELPRAVA